MSTRLREEMLLIKAGRFQDERLASINDNALPFSFAAGARLALHLLPLGAFKDEVTLTDEALNAQAQMLRPIGSMTFTGKVDSEGLISISNKKEDEVVAYSRLFRNGAVEAVTADFVKEHKGGYIIPVSYERYIIDSVMGYLGILSELKVACPIVLFISMAGVNGARMGVDASFMQGQGAPIEIDTLVSPELKISDYAACVDFRDTAALLRESFDFFWWACSYERSYNYDEDGNWVGLR